MAISKEEILKGTKIFYESQGELVPCAPFDRETLEELEKEKEIVILENPLGIGGDFFGLKNKPYPDTFKKIMRFRLVVELTGSIEQARKDVDCRTL